MLLPPRHILVVIQQALLDCLDGPIPSQSTLVLEKFCNLHTFTSNACFCMLPSYHIPPFAVTQPCLQEERHGSTWSGIDLGTQASNRSNTFHINASNICLVSSFLHVCFSCKPKALTGYFYKKAVHVSFMNACQSKCITSLLVARGHMNAVVIVKVIFLISTLK